MPNTIVVKHRESTTGEPTSLLVGEVASNINDKEFYVGTATATNIVFVDKEYVDGHDTPIYDTLAEAKAITAIPEVLEIKGYYDATDKAFGSNHHYLLPDDGTVYTEQGGVQFQTASGRWYRLSYKGQIIPEYYGCVGDAIVDDTINLQAACDDGFVVLSDSKTYLVSDTIHVTNGMKGLNTAIANIKVASNFPAGKVVLDFGGTDVFYAKDIKIFGAVNQDYINYRFGDNTNNDGGNRGFADNLFSYGGTKGYEFFGWINSIGKIYASGHVLGLDITSSMGCNFALIVIEDCDQYFSITNQNNVITSEQNSGWNIGTLTVEGNTGTNCTIPSVIDNVQSLHIGSLYVEGSSPLGSTAAIRIGENGYARGITIDSAITAAIATLDPLEKLIYIGKYAKDVYIKAVTSTSDNKSKFYIHKDADNVKIDETMTSGYREYYPQLVSKPNLLSNGDFSGGINQGGMMYAVDANTVFSLDSSNYITGNSALKVTTTVANSDTAFNIRLRGNYSNALEQFKGKKVNVGVWMYSSRGDTQPRIRVSVNETGSGFISYESQYDVITIPENTWKFVYIGDIKEIADDVFDFYIQMLYVGTPNIQTTDYVLIDSIIISEAGENEMISSPNIGINNTDLTVNGNNLIWHTEPDEVGTNSFVASSHKKGDIYQYPDPATAGYIGKVCTADGQAFASWSNYGALV